MTPSFCSQGGALPEQFIVPDGDGVRAGVDYAFLSTSLDREVAIDYAGDGGAATVFEFCMV